MKLLHALLLLFLTLNFQIFAQSPEKMSYQAIIRAQDNSLVINSKITLKVIVHQGAANGASVYQETHSVNTNKNGLISLEIGTGTVGAGSFSAIAWDKGPYFIETQVDVKGGTNYNIVGVVQLLSVPYALHAKTAERIVGGSNNTNVPIRSLIVPFVSSRNVAIGDVNNTIECTKSSTLTLTSNFGSMAVGETINLEAHNGAVLIIQAASGVAINYTDGGTAKFSSATGNVRFGLLRKSGLNEYIISGQ